MLRKVNIKLNSSVKSVSIPLTFDRETILKIKSGAEKYGFFILYKRDLEKNVNKATLRFARCFPDTSFEDTFDSGTVHPIDFPESVINMMLNNIRIELVLVFGYANGNVIKSFEFSMKAITDHHNN